MLDLELPDELAARVHEALHKAGKREIGGILMGEHVGPNRFVVRDLTIHSRGTFATFVRHVRQALSGLARFHERTGNQHRQFNYLGEWHSHPDFALRPSILDARTMREILAAPEMREAQFVVLVIVKLGLSDELQARAFTYLPGGSEHASRIAVSARPSGIRTARQDARS